jgi:predicted nucleic acid-binding protein
VEGQVGDALGGIVAARRVDRSATRPAVRRRDRTDVGKMSAGAQLRGRPRPQNDAWIAACCVRHGVPLVTLNTKDFAPFAEHDGLVLLTESN